MAGTAALQELKTALSAVRKLIQLELRESPLDPPPVRSRPIVGALRAAIAVLTVAAFESYLHNAFREVVGGLRDQVSLQALAGLPDKVRVTAVFGALERAMKGIGFGEPPKRADRLPDVLAACASVLATPLEPDVFADTEGNPDATTVNRMFGQIGCQDVLRDADFRIRFEQLWGTPVAIEWPFQKLEEVAARRHRAAHTGDAIEVPRTDLREGERFVRVLAGALDSKARAQCHHILGAARRQHAGSSAK